MGNLITPTLLDSYNFYKNSSGSWKEKALSDIENTLKRVYGEMSKPVKAGIDFENYLYSSVSKDVEAMRISDEFKYMARMIKGGEFQKKIKADINVNGVTYCLYGKIDVFFPTIIIDIKTTDNYRGPEKYLSGWQHRFYTYVTNVRKFRYLVAEWTDLKADNYKIKQVHDVDFEIFSDEQFKAVEQEIMSGIEEFMAFLNDNEHLKVAYETKFNLF